MFTNRKFVNITIACITVISAVFIIGSEKNKESEKITAQDNKKNNVRPKPVYQEHSGKYEIAPLVKIKKETIESPVKNVQGRNDKKLEHDDLIKKEMAFQKKLKATTAYFYGISDFESAFSNDPQQSAWSSKIYSVIENNVIYNKDGSSRFPSIDVKDLECRSTMCRLTIANAYSDDSKFGDERASLINNLIHLSIKQGEQGARAVKTSWKKYKSNNEIIYYISKGVGDDVVQ